MNGQNAPITGSKKPLFIWTVVFLFVFCFLKVRFSLFMNSLQTNHLFSLIGLNIFLFSIYTAGLTLLALIKPACLNLGKIKNISKKFSFSLFFVITIVLQTVSLLITLVGGNTRQVGGAVILEFLLIYLFLLSCYSFVYAIASLIDPTVIYLGRKVDFSRRYAFSFFFCITIILQVIMCLIDGFFSNYQGVFKIIAVCFFMFGWYSFVYAIVGLINPTWAYALYSKPPLRQSAFEQFFILCIILQGIGFIALHLAGPGIKLMDNPPPFTPLGWLFFLVTTYFLVCSALSLINPNFVHTYYAAAPTRRNTFFPYFTVTLFMLFATMAALLASTPGMSAADFITVFCIVASMFCLINAIIGLLKPALAFSLSKAEHSRHNTFDHFFLIAALLQIFGLSLANTARGKVYVPSVIIPSITLLVFGIYSFVYAVLGLINPCLICSFTKNKPSRLNSLLFFIISIVFMLASLFISTKH